MFKEVNYETIRENQVAECFFAAANNCYLLQGDIYKSHFPIYHFKNKIIEIDYVGMRFEASKEFERDYFSLM